MNELEIKVAQIQSLAFEEIMFLLILVYLKCKNKTNKTLYNLRQAQMTDGKIMKIIKNKIKGKNSTTGQNQESRSKSQLLHPRKRRKRREESTEATR